MSIIAHITYNMVCNNLSSSGRCGRCKYDILDSKYLDNVDILTLCRVLCKISWLDKFSERKDGKYEYNVHSIKVTCEGYVKASISYNKSFHITVIKAIIDRAVRIWKSTKNTETNYNSIEHIGSDIEQINSLDNIVHIRTNMLKLVKKIESADICFGKCVSISKDRNYSRCKFNINDANTISQMSALNIVHMFMQIVEASNRFDVLNLKVDTKNAYVTCNSKVILDGKTVSTTSCIDSLKKLHSYYFRIWRSANDTKYVQLNKIYIHCDNIEKCKHISDIYTTCQDFIDIL